jgi:hypothetical protein
VTSEQAVVVMYFRMVPPMKVHADTEIQNVEDHPSSIFLYQEMATTARLNERAVRQADRFHPEEKWRNP